MGRNKIAKSMSLSPGTVELSDAIIDMYGLGKDMTSKLADGVLSRAYACIADAIPEQTVKGVKFKVNFEIEFEEGE